MSEQTKDYSKLWSELSNETREICQLIGNAPTGLNNFELMVGEKESKVVLIGLKERGLILERTYREELEEKAKMISEDRKKEIISPPTLTLNEEIALNAIRNLEVQSEQSLNSIRLQLVRGFGKFVNSINDAKTIKNEVVNIQPGETTVVAVKLGGEPNEVQKALSIIENSNQLEQKYELMKQDELESEYVRINSDFELAMRQGDNLRAIMVVLVKKYNIDESDVQRLIK